MSDSSWLFLGCLMFVINSCSIATSVDTIAEQFKQLNQAMATQHHKPKKKELVLLGMAPQLAEVLGE